MSWEKVRLGDVAALRGGSAFKPHLQGKRLGKYPFIKVSDMNLPENRVFIHAANNWVDDDDLRELRATAHPAGATVFAKIGEALTHERRRQLLRPTVVDNNMMSAAPSTDRLDSRFLYYFLCRVKLQEIAVGTALPYLNLSTVADLKLPLPAIAEQRSIVAVLGSLDDKIDLNRRMTQTLEAMAQTLFRAWFVDFDPVRANAELFPARFVDSELGEIPEGWRVASLGEFLRVSRQQVNPADLAPETPYIGLEHMPRGSICLDTWESAEKVTSGKLAFRKGQILFGKLRPYFKKVGVALTDGVCSSDILVLDAAEPAYFGWLLGHLTRQEFIDFTSNVSSGTRMPRVSWEDMASFKVAVPPNSELLAAYNAQLQSLVERIERAVAESKTLAQLRDTLLPKLLSREMRVE